MNGDKCGGGNINIGFIGAGAVGCSMGKYLCENSSIAKIIAEQAKALTLQRLLQIQKHMLHRKNW